MNQGILIQTTIFIIAFHVGVVSAQSSSSISGNIDVKKRTKIDVVVAEFNELASKHDIGSSQPPLTSDEISAALIRWFIDRKKMTEKEKNGYFEVMETLHFSKSLRQGARISYTTEYLTRGIKFTTWSIDLTFEGHTYRIRDRLIRAEERKLSDKAERASTIKNDVPNREE